MLHYSRQYTFNRMNVCAWIIHIKVPLDLRSNINVQYVPGFIYNVGASVEY